MEKRDIVAECETEIAAIAKSREFWANHVSDLEQNGVQPSLDIVEWVRVHLEKLDASQKWLENHVAEIKERRKNEEHQDRPSR